MRPMTQKELHPFLWDRRKTTQNFQEGRKDKNYTINPIQEAYDKQKSVDILLNNWLSLYKSIIRKIKELLHSKVDQKK